MQKAIGTVECVRGAVRLFPRKKKSQCSKRKTNTNLSSVCTLPRTRPTVLSRICISFYLSYRSRLVFFTSTLTVTFNWFIGISPLFHLENTKGSTFRCLKKTSRNTMSLSTKPPDGRNGYAGLGGSRGPHQHDRSWTAERNYCPQAKETEEGTCQDSK